MGGCRLSWTFLSLSILLAAALLLPLVGGQTGEDVSVEIPGEKVVLDIGTNSSFGVMTVYEDSLSIDGNNLSVSSNNRAQVNGTLWRYDLRGTGEIFRMGIEAVPGTRVSFRVEGVPDPEAGNYTLLVGGEGEGTFLTGGTLTWSDTVDSPRNYSIIRNSPARTVGGVPGGAGLRVRAREVVTRVGPGNSEEVGLLLENNGSVRGSYTVSVEGLAGYILPREISRDIDPREDSRFVFDISVPAGREPGVEEGLMTARLDGKEREVPVTLIVPSDRERLVDVRLELEEGRVSPGEELRFTAEIFNLGQADSVDVTTFTRVRGENLTREVGRSGPLPLETRLSSPQVLDTSLPPGRYDLEVTAVYDGSTSRASQEFRVTRGGFLPSLPSSPDLDTSVVGTPLVVLLAGVGVLLIIVIIAAGLLLPEGPEERVPREPIRPPRERGPGERDVETGTAEDFVCETCGAVYSNERGLEEHKEVGHLMCEFCGKEFFTLVGLEGHQEKQHPGKVS